MLRMRPQIEHNKEKFRFSLGQLMATYIRPLVKRASGRQVQGAYGAQNRSIPKVREDSSTGATQQLSAGGAVCKGFILLGLLLSLHLKSSLLASVEKLSFETSQEEERLNEIEDPLQPLNQVFFDLNQGLDEVFLEPISEGYQAMLPPFVRKRIHNGLQNLSLPKTFINAVLQANPEKAGDSLLRFLVNSTVGILGLFDVATEIGLEVEEEDFGRTLQKAGIPTGPYLVLPIIGATHFRDGIGLLVDALTDPFNLIVCHNNHPNLMYVRWGADLVDWRTEYLESYRKLKETSLDLYSSVRSLYDQKRGDQKQTLSQNQQKGGRIDDEPTYNEELEE